MTRFYEYLNAVRYHVNGFRLRLYLRSTGCKVGKGLKCLRFPIFRDVPRGNIRIGDHVAFGRGVVFEITRTGSLEVGNEVTIGDNVRLSSAGNIRIGDLAGIAENISFRGSFHLLSKDLPFKQQGNRSADISVGRDALIGAGSVVLLGATVPDGAIVGALSLVTRHDNLHSYGIFGGSPLKHISDRP
ncbi:MAG: acyltransferase [Flavobacteriales bacterium]|nr:acyltransferase [Flavobacteriales bacterium]